ncbi:hypothetical protein [Mycobacterium sp. 1245852.3]|uniref:hypothetical protein n=1 Tax=Mycobacterium sp. 1245852.3 TaxID=1856860 RepID=UPI0012EAF779|nr:hypothetical protein [Mycobacterium sp. 1245852.3]
MANDNARNIESAGGADSAMPDRFELIQSPGQEFEDYITSGERIRRSFGFENGGKYAFYDGGSAVMTYRQEAADGGKAMHAEAVRSLGKLREVLKHLDFDALISGVESSESE